MMDLPQGADLAAHRLIAGGAVEELERSLLALEVIAYPVDLRKAAPPDYLEDLEAAVDDVADRVVRSLGPGRESHVCRVRFRECGSVASRRYGARCLAKIAALGRCEPAGAVPISGPIGVRLHMPDSPDGVHQARVQHVGAYVRREVKLLHVAHGVEAPPPGLVDVPEQAVLPQDGGEVRCPLEVQVHYFLQR